MYNYVTDSIKLHNTLMVLMEISLILELWILFSRIMREEKLKKMVGIVVVFFSSFFVFILMSLFSFVFFFFSSRRRHTRS